MCVFFRFFIWLLVMIMILFFKIESYTDSSHILALQCLFLTRRSTLDCIFKFEKIKNSNFKFSSLISSEFPFSLAKVEAIPLSTWYSKVRDQRRRREGHGGEGKHTREDWREMV